MTCLACAAGRWLAAELDIRCWLRMAPAVAMITPSAPTPSTRASMFGVLGNGCCTKTIWRVSVNNRTSPTAGNIPQSTAVTAPVKADSECGCHQNCDEGSEKQLAHRRRWSMNSGPLGTVIDAGYSLEELADVRFGRIRRADCICGGLSGARRSGVPSRHRWRRRRSVHLNADTHRGRRPGAATHPRKWSGCDALHSLPDKDQRETEGWSWDWSLRCHWRRSAHQVRRCRPPSRRPASTLRCNPAGKLTTVEAIRLLAPNEPVRAGASAGVV